jgi:hypothetical protein
VSQWPRARLLPEGRGVGVTGMGSSGHSVGPSPHASSKVSATARLSRTGGSGVSARSTHSKLPSMLEKDSSLMVDREMRGTLPAKQMRVIGCETTKSSDSSSSSDPLSSTRAFPLRTRLALPPDEGVGAADPRWRDARIALLVDRSGIRSDGGASVSRHNIMEKRQREPARALG